MATLWSWAGMFQRLSTPTPIPISSYITGRTGSKRATTAAVGNNSVLRISLGWIWALSLESRSTSATFSGRAIGGLGLTINGWVTFPAASGMASTRGMRKSSGLVKLPPTTVCHRERIWAAGCSPPIRTHRRCRLCATLTQRIGYAGIAMSSCRERHFPPITTSADPDLAKRATADPASSKEFEVRAR